MIKKHDQNRSEQKRDPDLVNAEIALKRAARKAREIAGILKSWIKEAKFFLTEPVEKLPSADSGYKFKPLKERKIET